MKPEGLLSLPQTLRKDHTIRHVNSSWHSDNKFVILRIPCSYTSNVYKLLKQYIMLGKIYLLVYSAYLLHASAYMYSTLMVSNECAKLLKMFFLRKETIWSILSFPLIYSCSQSLLLLQLNEIIYTKYIYLSQITSFLYIFRCLLHDF
jgi:hypothetical protein